jgi:GT2 family glycosyltransferase
MNIRPDLSVCILPTISHPEILDTFLSSLLQMDDHLAIEIVILGGNGVEKASLQSLQKLDFVKLVDVGKQCSFVAAANQALHISDGRYISLWYKTSHVAADCLVRLVDFLDEFPDAGIVAPALLNASEKQPVARVFPSLWELFHDADMPGKSFPEKEMATNKQVEWLSGPGLTINRHMIEEIGALSDRFPCYWTMEYCLRASRFGWRVYYCQQAQAVGFIENWSDQGHNRLARLQEKIALALLIMMHRFRP